MNPPEHVTRYIWLLLKLDKLMSEGNDGDEADAIRDEMDAPWYAATNEERDLFSALSVALYATHMTKGSGKGVLGMTHPCEISRCRLCGKIVQEVRYDIDLSGDYTLAGWAVHYKQFAASAIDTHRCEDGRVGFTEFLGLRECESPE